MISDLKHSIHRAKRALIDAMLLRGRRTRFDDSIIIETTNVCSLRCSCCPNGHDVERRKPGRMSVGTFDAVLANIDFPVRRCFLHMCGEPFLNPRLDYFCSELLKRKIYPTIFSNGYGIDLELLDRILALRGVKISFSMELQSAADYEAVRTPGRYDLATGHLKEINAHFAAAKKFYGLNIILRNPTGEAVRATSERLFAEYSQLLSITYSSMWPWPGLPETGDLAGHFAPRGSYCSQAKKLPAILWDGTATFCALDYGGAMPVGDLTRQRLSEVVNGSEARRIRRALAFDRRKASALCAGCVLPAFNSFVADVYRAKVLKGDPSLNMIYASVDEYFGNS